MKASASTALARRLLLFLALNAFALNGLLWVVSPPEFKDTVLRHTADFFHGKSGGDSWWAMSLAYDYVRLPHATPLYTEVMFHRRVKFQYPPSALFSIPALRTAGLERVRLAEFYPGPWPSINDILGWVCILVMIVSVTALFDIHMRRLHLVSDRYVAWALYAVIAAGFTLTFYPVMKAYTLGQIQV